MDFFERLPDNPEINYTDADYAEAVRDNEDVNKDISPEVKDRYVKNTELRGVLARVFTIIIAFWLLAVILILVGNNCKHYNLSDSVLNTLLTTSTIQVLGMMLIILKDLFPGGKDKKE